MPLDDSGMTTTTSADKHNKQQKTEGRTEKREQTKEKGEQSTGSNPTATPK